MDILDILNDKQLDDKLNIHNKINADRIRKVLAVNNVKYTEQSIDFVLRDLERSFEDLVEYSDENLKTIYQCGVPSHSREDALEIMKALRQMGITYREQHQIMVYDLKKEHFFMSGQNRENYLNLIAVLAMR